MYADDDHYAIDITNVSEDQRGDLSQRLHELMHTGLDIVKVGSRTIGKVHGRRGGLATDILREKGYDVKLYHGCGHCLHGMVEDGGRCDCECHG
jgi:hypothetical protein